MIGLSGAFAGICLSLWFWNTDMLDLMLAPQLQIFVLISGIVLSFYFPRRRVWLRRVGPRLEVAMPADRYVDLQREFAALIDDLARVTRRSPEAPQR